MAPLGIAIIGGGIFAREQHIPAALASPEISIKAIWSRSLSSAKEAAKLIPGDHVSTVDLYSTDSGEGKSYDDLLKRPDITGVLMALPIMDQPIFIEKAIAAGKHVLAEKPVAPDVAAALKYIENYHKVRAETKATWAVAENWRFIEAMKYAASEIKTLGKITGFTIRLAFMMAETNKYYKTSWRTKPEFQGGFLLDGGVHFTTGLRLLLGKDNAIETLSAHTAQTRSHLPPIDTVNAVLKTKTGIVGSYGQAVGSYDQAFEFIVACENGVVKAEPSKVVVTRGTGESAQTEEKVYERDMGIKAEVRAWAQSLVSGVPNPDQSPEEALADLELMEKMFRSGEENGAPQKTQYQ